MNIKSYRNLSIVLILFNALGALAGGGGLIYDPTGATNYMPLEMLQYSPFNDFFVPGLILFTVNGVFGLWVFAMIISGYQKYPHYIIAQAVLLGGWIIVQVIMLRSIHFLHVIYFTIALALFLLGVLQKKILRKRLSSYK